MAGSAGSPAARGDWAAEPLLDERNDACRLCFSEADELPGLVVDKYGELVILQLLAKGLDSAAVRERACACCAKNWRRRRFWSVPTRECASWKGWPRRSSSRAAMDLPKSKAAAMLRPRHTIPAEWPGLRVRRQRGTEDGSIPRSASQLRRCRANGRGSWTWQAETGGRALDVCCYQGGFALHLAQVCAQVTGIDASRASLEVAERNFEANRRRLTAQVDWVEGDAFQILRDWSDAGERFDAIVLDPPAFAKSQRAVEGALRGYKELNLRALKMLRPGGLLVTCSCSHHVGWAELEGERGLGRRRCASAGAAAGAARSRSRSSRGAEPAGDRVPEVPDPGGGVGQTISRFQSYDDCNAPGMVRVSPKPFCGRETRVRVVLVSC